MYSSNFSAFVIDILLILCTVSQRSKLFYEISSLAIYINIKTFNRVNREQVNILKTFLEYLEFSIVATEDDSALKLSKGTLMQI